MTPIDASPEFYGESSACRQFEIRSADLMVLSIFSLVYVVTIGRIAALAPMWFDELFTFHLSQLESPADLWNALAAGADGNPPLYYLMVQGIASILGPGELAMRLPSLIGFWLLCGTVYLFTARRLSRAIAVVALIFPLATTMAATAATARSYGWLLGCTGSALYCWQCATSSSRRKIALAGLATSLAAAFASHYYAFLAFAPLALGELVRTWQRRRIDAPACLALAAGPAALVALLPLFHQTRASMAVWFGSPDWHAAAESYLFLLKFVRWPLLAAFAVTGLTWMRRVPTTGPAESNARLPSYEAAAMLGFIALPLVGVVVSQWTRTTFTVRYAAPAIIGFTVLLACLANASRRILKPAALLLTIVLLGRFAQATRSEFRRAIDERAAMSQRFRAIEALDSGTPVVIADPFDFLKLYHYAPDSLRSRLTHLNSPQSLRTDSREWVLAKLTKWADLPVVDCRVIASGHGRLCSADGTLDCMPP